MNVFQDIAQTLTRVTAPRCAGARPITPARPTTLTDSIRQLLAERGAMTALAIAVELDIEAGSGRVGALLKADLAKGRIVRIGDRYRLCDIWNEEDQAEIRSAVALLRRRGYRITRDTGGTA